MVGSRLRPGFAGHGGAAAAAQVLQVERHLEEPPMHFQIPSLGVHLPNVRVYVQVYIYEGRNRDQFPNPEPQDGHTDM